MKADVHGGDLVVSLGSLPALMSNEDESVGGAEVESFGRGFVKIRDERLLFLPPNCRSHPP